MSESIDSLFDEEAAVLSAPVELDDSDSTFNESLRMYRALRDEKDALAAREKDINKQITALEDYIRQVMVKHGWTTIKKDDVGRVTLKPNSYPRVLDFDRMVSWLCENGHDGIAKMSINANTLRSWVKEQLALGALLPPSEVLETNPGVSISLTRS